MHDDRQRFDNQRPRSCWTQSPGGSRLPERKAGLSASCRRAFKCKVGASIKECWMIDPLYIPVAAFWGSAIGSVTTVLSNWVTERRKQRVRRKALAISQRHKLYKKFIEEASRRYADALVNDKSEASKLVEMYALIGRMKVISSDEVIEEAEKVGRLIIQTYLSPNRAFADLAELIDEMDPLRGFSDACRRELQTV